MKRACLALILIATAASAKDPEPPKELLYGPYAHYLASKAKAELGSRAIKVVQSLRGLYYTCPKCRGYGEISVTTRKRYYDSSRGVWVPARKVKRTCPKCKRKRFLFSEKVVEGFLRSAFTPGVATHRRASRIRTRWRRTLKASEAGFRKIPQLRCEVTGRYGQVHGYRVALFPIPFVLVPIGRGRYEWSVHDQDLHGPFRFGADRPALPQRAKVRHVWAADALQLENGTIVRVCGICVPTHENKIPKPDHPMADEAARETVRSLLENKIVTLTPDTHSSMTLDGHAIAFVEVDGRDLGADLLRSGVVRKHPKHVHQRRTRYVKAETEAREAEAGCWGR